VKIGEEKKASHFILGCENGPLFWECGNRAGIQLLESIPIACMTQTNVPGLPKLREKILVSLHDTPVFKTCLLLLHVTNPWARFIATVHRISAP
jgi:hypothetical protein